MKEKGTAEDDTELSCDIARPLISPHRIVTRRKVKQETAREHNGRRQDMKPGSWLVN